MVDSMTPEELAALLKEPGAKVVLVDVREDDERATCRIDPSVHIPIFAVATRFQEIPRDRKVVVYCHHGGRSEMVAGFLSTQGYPDVANLDGGIDAWARQVDPSVARY